MGANQSLTSKEILINCDIHETPFNGICGERDCDEGFICLKCNPDSCTVSRSHGLVTVNEFYDKFLISNKSIDYIELAEFIEKTKQIDKDYIKCQIEKYILNAEHMINEKLNGLNFSVISRLEQFKKNVAARLLKIHNEYMESERRIDLSNLDIPESFGLEETKKFFDKNFNSTKEMENMVNLIKKYSDKEKLQMNQRDMETVLYTKNLADNSLDDIIKEKLDAIIKELSEGLEEIAKLFDNKNEVESNIYSFGYTKFSSDPTKLKTITEISDKAQKSYTIDSAVSAFTTLTGKNYVAWPTPQFTIMVYDLGKETLVYTFTGNTQHLYIVRHYACEKTNSDYLLTTCYDKSCKIYNVTYFTLTLTIANCHNSSYLYSGLMLFDNDNTYVLTSAPNEYTKVWDFNSGKYVKDIGTNTDYTYYLNKWHDHESNNIYIVNGNSVDVKLYNFKTGALYKSFKPKSAGTWHMSAFVSEFKNAPHIFETDGNGNFRIWDIKSGSLAQSIKLAGNSLRGLSFWNDQYVIAAASDHTLKVIDIKNFSTFSLPKGHDDVICSVEKTVHPIHGECLITASIDGKIKLWTQ